MKTKFKMTKEEMLAFNDDCNNAANRCPQHCNRWAIDDRVILLGGIRARDLVKHWRRSEELWGLGYHEHLTLDARDVFHQYDLYRLARKIEKIKQKQGGS